MTGASLAFGCTCGTVRGTLTDISPKTGTQLRCHCTDCRRAIVWLGQADPSHGVRYVQTTPNRVQFDQGIDALGAFRWKSPRLVRWYATCCNTPLFNTLDTPKWAFASVLVDALDDPAPLGPIKAEAFVPKPNGKAGHINMPGFIWGFVKRVVRARIGGSWRDTPFFDTAGAPITQVQTLTRDDRSKAVL